jgi:hypothetical protein
MDNIQQMKNIRQMENIQQMEHIQLLLNHRVGHNHLAEARPNTSLKKVFFVSQNEHQRDKIHHGGQDIPYLNRGRRLPRPEGDLYELRGQYFHKPVFLKGKVIDR